MTTTRRFESEFDPDDLAKITHRGLQPLSKKEQPSVTNDARSTLKTAAREEESFAVAGRRVFDRFFGGIFSFVKGLFAAPAKKVTMCANYGHVLKAGWKGEFPVCSDCGIIITSTDQVRGASVKNPKKWDDQYSKNNGRKYVR